jgi:hypothetical protein
MLKILVSLLLVSVSVMSAESASVFLDESAFDSDKKASENIASILFRENIVVATHGDEFKCQFEVKNESSLSGLQLTFTSSAFSIVKNVSTDQQRPPSILINTTRLDIVPMNKKLDINDTSSCCLESPTLDKKKCSYLFVVSEEDLTERLLELTRKQKIFGSHHQARRSDMYFAMSLCFIIASIILMILTSKINLVKYMNNFHEKNIIMGPQDLTPRNDEGESGIQATNAAEPSTSTNQTQDHQEVFKISSDAQKETEIALYSKYNLNNGLNVNDLYGSEENPPCYNQVILAKQVQEYETEA